MRDSSMFVWIGAAATLTVASGVSAHFLTERQPLLLPMSLAVILLAGVLTKGVEGLRILYVSVAAGAVLWGAEQVVYAATHLAAGEAFSADRFGPQWLQAIMLVLAHAILLGVPSGLVAGLILYVLRGRRRQALDAS